WAVDDGARTAEDSLEMLHLLREIGFRTVYATPHQKVDAFVPDAETIAARYDDLRGRLAAAGSDLDLRVAAENYWDELLLVRAQRDEQPSYRDAPPVPSGKATPAFLFELPIMQLPPRLSDQLFALRLRGRLPVLAHPERYIQLWGHWDRLAQLARCAALVVDLP